MNIRRQLAFLPSALLASMLLLLVACCSKECTEKPGVPHETIQDDATSSNITEQASNSTTTNAVAVEKVEPVVQPQPRAALEKSDLDIKKISRSVAYSLPLYHLNRLPLDENISTNAYNLFISSLDPARSYFLQSDIDSFEAESKVLHKKLSKGDIEFARTVFNVLMERIENRNAFAEELLEEGFDTTTEENFQWDRKEAAWAQNEAEWNDLWRKRLKNEYIARLVSKQVYADEESSAVTNTVDSAETIITNIVADADAEYDDDAETANLSPEEFILERYKQFKLTMETFDDEMLLQRYLSSFSQVYDPHSDYMSPSSVEDFDINMKLSLVGIGALLRPDDGMIRIVRIIPGGPADQDGRLKPGDRIIAVAQGDKEPESVLHRPLYKTVRIIRGEIGTKVVLTVIPASDRSGIRTTKIDLIREEVKLEEQAAKSKVREVELDDGTTRRLGVITLPDFYADFKATNKNEKDARRASTDVRRLINELMLEGIEGLVLDLRNNGGGSLLESIETAGLFISSGPIVQVKEHDRIQVLPDADPEKNYDGPMIVLVNRLSASASEILAAALQDYKRAIIVGDQQTHGKGTVQTLLPLLGGPRRGSLKITTAGFYRINGGSTQLKGVIPDIIIPSYLDVMDLGEDSLQHALPWDTVRKAMYRTESGLTEWVPQLAEQSSERLAANAEFQTYLVRRDRLKERFETKTVSLSLENRIAEAEAEKELDDIQSGSFLEEDDEEDDSKDLTLTETLHILSDLIDLKESGNQPIDPTEMLAPVLSASDGR